MLFFCVRCLGEWDLNAHYVALCFFFPVRKLIKSPGETVIRVFKFLPKYIKEEELAKKLVDLLLLFVAKKPESSGQKISYISSCSIFILTLFIAILISILILRFSLLYGRCLC